LITWIKSFSIWLERHKDDLSDKFDKKTKIKGDHANFIQYQ
jgi:hypothetical protein